jgi:RNA polymerase sigma factor (sigma-70 family)
MSQASSDRLSPETFPSTRWSRVIEAGNLNEPHARESLADLCEGYWYPLYAFIRRRGHDPEQAKDLTQDFFAHLLERGILAQADPARGRFRSFLRTVCADYLANRRERENARKRGGGRTFLPIDTAEAEGRYVRELAEELTPERIFDRSWAIALLGRVLEQLRREYEEAGKAATFEALRGGLEYGPGDAPHVAIAARLGTSEGAARVAAHRLRRHYGELLRREIASTLEDPAEVDDEIRDLFVALGARSMDQTRRGR